MTLEKQEQIVARFDNETEAMEVAIATMIKKNGYYENLRTWAQGDIISLASGLYYYYFKKDISMNIYEYLDKFEEYLDENKDYDIEVGDLFDELAENEEFNFS